MNPRVYNPKVLRDVSKGTLVSVHSRMVELSLLLDMQPLRYPVYTCALGVLTRVGDLWYIYDSVGRHVYEAVE